MKKKNLQSEKLFSYQELNMLVEKIDSLTLMGKIEAKHQLGKIFNDTYYADTFRVQSKYNRRKKAKSRQ
jgi:hypothetical protein